MANMRSKFAAAIAGVFIAAPAAAWAEDFNIEVPIELTSLPPDIVSFNVDCVVRTSEADSGEMIGNGGVVGVSIRGGTHRDSVFVRFNALPLKDPTRAHYYRCILSALRTAAGRTYNASEINLGRAFPLAGPATVQTSGTIPR